ncbi:Y4bD/Y4pK family protein [Mycoavidus sp. SF9855]|uniref:Y4bD/Y4pK family protein n=1 Tax=Mycoavidus sp. SF9855 TaxID=2968475 RepID=UPI00211C6EA7|nr:Y4bD/Y4pK family protein [Mycoavidus sp. SF9855]UUM21567.1 Y4bD/Y4pK family protein [Mycoavidus sp. SF9855]
MPNHHLGLAEILHPFHPLRGQRFPVLKTRRVAGIDTLILSHAERGSFSIPREWTDWGAPSAHDGQEAVAHYFDLGMLLDLTALIDQLPHSSSKK